MLYNNLGKFDNIYWGTIGYIFIIKNIFHRCPLVFPSFGIVPVQKLNQFLDHNKSAGQVGPVLLNETSHND